MRQITAIIVGNGDRANCYCKYAVTNPECLKIIGVVDPDKRKQKEAIEKYKISEDMCFDSVYQCAKLGRIADSVINTTMDELHYETAIPMLKLGYNMLLEKPVCNNMAQLLEIQKTAKANNCIIMVCHVLRYTPFYRKIKQLIINGEIGEIVHIETNENVGVAHSSNSYIRGKWNNEEICGSSMLLAKCCHDLDLLCWLNNNTHPVKVSSFGGRNFLIKEKAPIGAGERCLVDCPLVDTCIYSAKAIYVDNNNFPWYSWQCIDKNYNDITLEERIESLKTNNPHGVCAYKTNANIVDHQALIIEYKNGSTAMHSMVQGVARACRKIHIMGTLGEIEGRIESCMLYLRKFDKSNADYTEQTFNVADEIPEGDHHAGGDAGIIRDFVRIVNGEQPSISCTKIDDSIYGHLCVYKADESRKDKITKDICID